MHTPFPARPVPATQEQLDRLADALRGLGSPLADRLAGPTVAVADGHVPDFPRWEVLTVAEQGAEHAVMTSVAVAREGRDPQAAILDGSPETWARLVEGIEVDDPAAARHVAERYLGYAAGGRRVTVVSDESGVPWLDPWSEASAEVLRRGQAAVAGAVEPPLVEEAHDGWRVRLSVVDQDRLVCHELTLRRDGTVVDDSVTVVASDLLVPVTG